MAKNNIIISNYISINNLLNLLIIEDTKQYTIFSCISRNGIKTIYVLSKTNGIIYVLADNIKEKIISPVS